MYWYLQTILARDSPHRTTTYWKVTQKKARVSLHRKIHTVAVNRNNVMDVVKLK